MDDGTFLARLADASLAPADFDHAGHVRAAFLVLRREPTFGAALDRMAGLIRHFATTHGQADKYHETITVAFMALVNARLRGRPPVPAGEEGWPAFAAANPDLMDKAIVAGLYPDGALGEPLSRQVFVLPGDRPAAAEKPAAGT